MMIPSSSPDPVILGQHCPLILPGTIADIVTMTGRHDDISIHVGVSQSLREDIHELVARARSAIRDVALHKSQEG